MADSFQAPTHVGFILDGNRRWARERNLPTLDGHKHGMENVEPITKAAFDRGIKFVSYYVFSVENWSRTQEEVGYLMRLFLTMFKKDSERLIKEGYKIVFQGLRDDRVNKSILKAIDKLERDSATNTLGTVSFCFNYGGQQEIVDACKQIVAKAIPAEDLDIETFADHVYQPEVPNLDLMIRTSGEQRISGFQLWRMAYAEMLFIDKYWPDFSASDLDDALVEYSSRQRRFGGN